MSTYFPFGIPATTTSSINHANTAITANVPASATTTAYTASSATTVINTPPAGINGTTPTETDCNSKSAPTGPQGATGVQGPQGTNLTSCPPGSIECPGLSKSGYTKVCIQYGSCTPSLFTCPPSIP